MPTGNSIRLELNKSLKNETEATMKSYKRDTKNKLNKEECEKFLSDYEKFIKKDIKEIINPKTKNKTKKYSRIEYIAKKCKEQLDLNDSEIEYSQDPENIKKGYQYIKTVDDILIKKLLELCEKTKTEKYKIIKIFFTKKLKEKLMLKILEEYIMDDNIEHKGGIKLLKKIVELIKEYFIPNYYLFIDKKDFEKELKDKYSKEDNYEDIMIRSGIVIDRLLLYRNNNTNKIEFFDNIEKNEATLQSYIFILSKIMKIYVNEDYKRRNIIKNIELLKTLLNKDLVIQDPDATPSFYKSPSWSKTPSESDKLIEYKTNKEKELNRIMNNKLYNGEINTADFYTLEEWKDMSLNKLKHVIIIPYENKGKKYASAYYVKSLYKAWYIAEKENKYFINQSNKKPFNTDDKEIILKYINKIYPNLKAPRYGKSGRKDIIVKFNRNIVNRRNVQQILIYYNFNNIKYDNNLNHELINISYPESFSYVDDDTIPVEENYVPLNYNPTFLLDIVNKLSCENNIVGRTIPFKINDVFKKYNFKLLTKSEYMSFFNELKILI
jgi:hypothetical protein